MNFVKTLFNKFGTSNITSINPKNFLINDSLKKGAIYTTDRIFAYFVSNIAVYFILCDEHNIVKFLRKLIPESKLSIIHDKLKCINKVICMELLLVIFTTAETIFGFWILNIKNAVILGFICGILDILPYVGNIIVFVPLIIYKFIGKQYIIALGLIFLYILLIIIRQIIEAKYVGNKLNIHPLVILISLYVGIELFGFMGLLIGPIYVICAKELIFNS